MHRSASTSDINIRDCDCEKDGTHLLHDVNILDCQIESSDV